MIASHEINFHEMNSHVINLYKINCIVQVELLILISIQTALKNDKAYTADWVATLPRDDLYSVIARTFVYIDPTTECSEVGLDFVACGLCGLYDSSTCFLTLLLSNLNRDFQFVFTAPHKPLQCK